MSGFLRRLISWSGLDKDPFEADTNEKIREHREAVSENRAVREITSHSVDKLEQAVLTSKLRSMRFAEFENSIRENHDHV